MPSETTADLKADALHFHREPRPGKLEIAATKPLANQRDLALAYSPASPSPARRSPPIPTRPPISPRGRTSSPC